MSQRRPPEDETDHEKAEADRAAGLRSQTRPAQTEWGKTRPLDNEGLGARPTPMRPEPGRAFAHGKDARGDQAEEPTVRVARSVFAGVDAAAASDEVTRAAPRPQPTATSQRPVSAGAAPERTHLLGSAEPLRAPSNRPTPAPYQAHRASAKATLLMTDTGPKSGGNKPGEARAQGPAGVSAGRHPGGTFPVNEADIRSLVPTAAGAGSKSAVKPPPRGMGSTAPVPQTPAIEADAGALSLQLDAGDMLEQPVDLAPPMGPKRSPGLVIGVIVALLAIAGAGIWYGTSGSGSTPAEVPPSRNDMQAVEPAPGEAPTAVPTAVNPASGVQPAPTGGPAAAPANAAQPSAAAPAAKPGAAPAGSDKDDKASAPAAEPPKKAESRARARRRASAKGAASAPVSDDVAAAREALRNLQTGGPVLKVQPSEEIPAPDDGPSLAPPAPPEPPPPDPEE